MAKQKVKVYRVKGYAPGRFYVPGLGEFDSKRIHAAQLKQLLALGVPLEEVTSTP